MLSDIARTFRSVRRWLGRGRLRVCDRRWNRSGRGPVVLRSQSKTCQRERVDFAVVRELLIGLETLQRIHRIVAPLAVDLSFEVPPIGERLLNLLVSFGIGMELVARGRWRPRPGDPPPRSRCRACLCRGVRSPMYCRFGTSSRGDLLRRGVRRRGHGHSREKADAYWPAHAQPKSYHPKVGRGFCVSEVIS